MIPKIIHQTWKTKDIPDNWKHAVESCKKNNKNYKYILWTDETMDKFIKKNFFYFYKTYKAYKYHIQRCDVFRYFVLYKYGGIYLDMDIVCNKKLDDLLDNDIVLAHSTNVETTFTNAFYMVIPNHPFIKFCIDNLTKNMYNYSLFGKFLHVMYSTGPLFLTKMIDNYGKIPKLYVLSKKEFAGDCNVCNENTCKGGTYFTNIQGNSWHEIDAKIFNFLFCNHKKIIGGVLIGTGILFFI